MNAHYSFTVKLNLERRRVKQIIVIAVVVGFLVLAWLATEPFKLSDGELPIDRRTRWIEVPGDPIEVDGYAAEGLMVPIPIEFSEPYVSHILVYLIWLDDSRTESDTFQIRVLNSTGDQVIAGSGNSGQIQSPARLNNNEVRHVVNNENWTVEVLCLEARDGYLGPGGVLKIPDDGNEFRLRIEWKHYIEHNPDWQ